MKIVPQVLLLYCILLPLFQANAQKIPNSSIPQNKAPRLTHTPFPEDPKLKTLIELYDFTRLATTLDEILLHASKKANTLENPNEEYIIKLRGTLPGIDEKRKKARYLLALRFHENLRAQELLKQLNGNMQPDILTTTMEVDMKKVQGKKSEFASLLMNL